MIAKTEVEKKRPLWGKMLGVWDYLNLDASVRYPATLHVKTLELFDKGEHYRDLATIGGSDELDMFGKEYLSGIMTAQGTPDLRPSLKPRSARRQLSRRIGLLRKMANWIAPPAEYKDIPFPAERRRVFISHKHGEPPSAEELTKVIERQLAKAKRVEAQLLASLEERTGDK